MVELELVFHFLLDWPFHFALILEVRKFALRFVFPVLTYGVVVLHVVSTRCLELESQNF